MRKPFSTGRRSGLVPVLSLLALLASQPLDAQQPQMVAIPGGSFSLGCTPAQQPCAADNTAHTVTLDSFFLSAYEVTQAQYLAVMGNNPAANAACAKCPVENVSWYDALRYCNRLSQQAGLAPCYYADADLTAVFDGNSGPVYWNTEASGYRLPTEAEWEYAARSAGADDLTYAGSNTAADVAWLAANSGGSTRPGGQLAPNALGFYDMSGNAAEWVWDHYATFSDGPVCNPLGPVAGSNRVLRGGDFQSDAAAARLAFRATAAPGSANGRTGFRVCSDQAPAITLPDCVSMLTAPANNATAVALTSMIEWTAAANATGYRISLSTTPGGTDLVNNQDLGDTLRYDYPGCFPQNTTIHVTITPYNAAGDAVGCAEFSFTTGSGVSDMVLMPAGTFEMGCTAEQIGCGNDEDPIHLVTLDSFWINRYEVTQCNWESLMGNWTYYFGNCGNNCPAEQVSWYDVITYCNRLSLQEGLEPVYYFDPIFTNVFDTLIGNLGVYLDVFWKMNAMGYRLPTEAEWEYSARGAGAMPQTVYSGSNTVWDVSWYALNTNTTRPVGLKQPNALGIYDMSGNVFEWCWDFYSDAYYSNSAEYNPVGPFLGPNRVCRGGSYNVAPHNHRVADRNVAGPGTRNANYGFRLARGMVSQPLSCVPSLTTPTPNDTAVALTIILEWQPAANTTGYRISLGTSPGGTDLINGLDLGDTLRYDYPGCFPQNTTIHVTITPYNTAGPASGCAGFSFTTGSGVPDMVLVPGGTINLGGTAVTIDSLQIGRYEVTQCEWIDIMDYNPSIFTSCGGDCPVERVSWYNAATFCNRLSLQEGFEPVYYLDAGYTQVFDSLVDNKDIYVDIFWKTGANGYRLPTEAEWEYAARAATDTPNYTFAGSNTVQDVAWYNGNSSTPFAGYTTHPVGQKQANGLGLYDMSGNAIEWCWDWWSATFPFGSNNPTGPPGGSHRIERGGSKSSPPISVSVWYRGGYWPGANGGVLGYGFRLARSLPNAPSCVPTLTTPAPNDTAVALTTIFEWQPAPNATGYRISLGTTPGGTDLVNGLDLGDTLRYDYPGCFPQNTTIHVTITPYNAAGPASGCAGFSFTTGSGVPDMVLVPGGTINLGGENPTTPVTIDSFYMGRYEVTQCEWESVMGSNPSLFTACGGDCPVEVVSWYDVLVFCNRLSIQQGRTPVYSINGSTNPDDWGAVPTTQDPTWDAVVANWNANGYRLPTEAEWEYAARGATNSPNYLSAGGDSLDLVGWYSYNSQVNYTPNHFGQGTHPKGEKGQNGLGLFDMSGNVREWCWDWWGGTFPSGQNNPTGSAGGLDRVMRGGDFLNNQEQCRVAYRGGFGFSSYIRASSFGFRLVLVP